jgi:hypothetical protein
MFLICDLPHRSALDLVLAFCLGQASEVCLSQIGRQAV